MRKCFLLFFLLFSFCGGFAQPTLSLDWQDKEPVARGRFIKHDSQKNIINVGTTGSNLQGTYVQLYISKHDTVGNVLWKHFLSGNGGLLRPKDMLIDSADNIYITGRADYDALNAEGFILKYDTQGNLNWIKYFGVNEGWVGEFNQMTIYNNQYIYIAGKMDSLSGNGQRKSVLVKYNNSGNLLWAKLDTEVFRKEGVSAEVDKGGNVYLIGITHCCLPGTDMFVEKYDSLGNKKWETVVLDTTYQYGYSIKSAVDDSSNIYITGEIAGLNVATSFDCGTVKIDSSGNLKWFNSFVNNPNILSSEEGTGVFTDKQGSCYVYGISTSNNLNSGFLLQYSSSGILNWSIVGDGMNGTYNYLIFGVLLVNDSEIVVGANGGLGGTNHGNVFAYSISTSGNYNWSTAAYPSFGNDFDFDYLNNSIYYTGSIADTNYIEPDSLFLVKYNINNATAINEAKLEFGNVFVFPNPVTNDLTIRFSSNLISERKIVIYNSLGEKIYSTRFSGSYTNYNSSSLSSGIYLLEITDGINVYRKKIIKQ